MTCKKCGQEISDDSEFCSKCGAKQSENLKNKHFKRKHIISRMVEGFTHIHCCKIRIKKKHVIFLSTCFLLIVIVGVGISIFTNPTFNFNRALDKRDYVTAAKIYTDKLKNDEKAKKSIEQAVNRNVDAIVEQATNKKIDYAEAISQLSGMQQLNVLSSKIQSSITSLQILKNSKTAYDKAIEYENSEDYINAILQYSQVVANDTDYYSNSRNKILVLSQKCRTDILSSIDEEIKKGNYDKADQLVKQALQAIPNDAEIVSRKNKIESLRQEAKQKAEEQKIEKLKDAQQVAVSSAKIYVQSDEYKSLYPDMIQVIVQNLSGKTVKSFVVGCVAFDSNGYPIKIKTRFSFSDNYEFTGNAEDANILNGESFGSSKGYNLDENHGIATVLSCVKSATFYDGSNWTNPYYDYWIKEYKQKPLH